MTHFAKALFYEEQKVMYDGEYDHLVVMYNDLRVDYGKAMSELIDSKDRLEMTQKFLARCQEEKIEALSDFDKVRGDMKRLSAENHSLKSELDTLRALVQEEIAAEKPAGVAEATSKVDERAADIAANNMACELWMFEAAITD
jgi:chromosome segregation ATPase